MPQILQDRRGVSEEIGKDRGFSTTMKTGFPDRWQERRPPKRAEVPASRRRVLAIKDGKGIAMGYLNCPSLPEPRIRHPHALTLGFCPTSSMASSP